MTLRKNNCDSYLTKYVKIPNNATNILQYLENKITCGMSTRVYDRVLPSGKIVKLQTLFYTFPRTHAIYKKSKYQPTLIKDYANENTSKTVDSIVNLQNTLKYNDKKTECAICDKLHIDGFIDEKKSVTVDEISYKMKYTLGYYHPYLDETYLIYKNFIITNNDSPYMNNHLMLCLLNHEIKKIKGSQYEILNREVLEDVINFYIKVNETHGVSMGHNYALTGSQTHFHIHMFIKENNDDFGYDNFLTHVSLESHKYVNSLSEEEIKKTPFFELNLDYDEPDTDDNMDDSYNCICYINANTYKNKTIINRFIHNKYGYMGYLVSILREHLNDGGILQNYISTVHRFINKIEKDGVFSFTLYFVGSQHIVGIVILPQKKVVISSLDIAGITSFRNITGFIFTQNTNITRYDYLKKVNTLSNDINRYIDINIYDANEMQELLKNKLDTNSIYGNINTRYLVSTNEKVINEYIEKIISNFDAISDNPKVIIVNAPYGGGKSIISKNINNYFDFYDPNKFIHIDIDEILLSIPEYSKTINDISTQLKRDFLNKPFNTYTNTIFHRYGTKTINDLMDAKLYNEFEIEHYIELYDILLNTKLDHSAMSIQEKTKEIFTKYSNLRQKMFIELFKICNQMNCNIVVEIARREFSNIQTFFPHIKIDNIYYVGYDFDMNNQKFILRNVLYRNINVGRVIESTVALDMLNNMKPIIESYKKNIQSNNFILINQGLVIDKINLLDQNIRDANFSIFEHPFLEQYNPDQVCINQNNYDELNNELYDKDLYKILHNKDGDQTIMCFGSKIINNENETRKAELKKIISNFNVEYLLDENASAILILNTFEQIRNFIHSTIEYYNRNKQPGVAELLDDDIKIVLKGGMNFRFYINIFIDYIKLIIKENKINNLDIEKMLKFFTDLENSNIENPFQKINNKSDIDFIIIMNKNKLSKENYNMLKLKLSTLIMVFLLKLRNICIDNKFFGNEYKIYKNLHKIPNIDGYITYKIQTVNTRTKLIKDMYKTSNRYSSVLINVDELKFNNDLNKNPSEHDKSYYIIPEKNFTTLSLIYPKIDINQLDVYYVTYSKNINFKYRKYNDASQQFEISDNEFDLLRLKNNYRINEKYNGIANNYNIGGEIIDIVIPGYDNLDQSDWESINTIHYANNMYNIDINVFNLNYLSHDYEKMLFEQSLFPWKNKKYEKRLYRYIMTLFINKIISAPDSTMFENINREIDGLISQINLLSKIDDNTQIAPTHIFAKLFNVYIKDIKTKIRLLPSSVDQYINLLRVYNYAPEIENIELEIADLINGYNQFITNIKDSISLLPFLLTTISKNILTTKFYIKNMRELFANRTIPDIKQFGGIQNIKHLYEKYKELYYNLKGGVIDIRRINATTFEIYKNADSLREFNVNQHNYLQLFLLKIIKEVMIDGNPFTRADVDSATVLGSGSFGVSAIITNSATNKKFVMKIIGSKAIDTESTAFVKDVLKETFSGFYLTQNNTPVFNKTLAYFKCSQTTSDIYFNSIDNTITFTNTYNNSNKVISDGNLFIIFIDAGKDSLTNLFKDLTQQNYARIMTDAVQELLKIRNISKYNQISKKTIYITHNDIKPDNMIYKMITNASNPLLKTFSFEFIDYGGFKFSDNFFTSMEVHTEVIRQLVYYDSNLDDAYGITFTSPLYDICSVIISIFHMITLDWFMISYILVKLKDNIRLSPLNFALLNVNINALYDYIYICISREVLKVTIIDTTIESNLINLFINKFMIYVLLYLSINKYININKTTIFADYKNNYSSIVFTDFTYITTNYNNITKRINCENTVLIKDLKNMALINKIFDLVEIDINKIHL